MLASSFIVFIAGAAIGLAHSEYPTENHPDQRYGDHHGENYGQYGDRHRGQPMLTLYVTSLNLHTTMVTVTSCHGGVCTTKPMVTGLTTITENQTVFTTYCPISSDGGHRGGHHGPGGPDSPGGVMPPTGPSGSWGPGIPGSSSSPGVIVGPSGEVPTGLPNGEDASDELPMVNPENGAASGAVPVIVLAVAGMVALIL